MGRRIRSIAVALSLSAALAIPGLVSAAAAYTTISGTFDDSTGLGTFSVDSGPLAAVCSAGWTSDDTFGAGAPPSGRVFLYVKKTFYCDEGPTFLMALKVRLDFVPEFSDTFSWSVLSGTDELSGLKGAGTGYGDSTGDHYIGKMVLG